MIRLPNVYTIPPGVPFAKTLAETLWLEYADKRDELSDVQIYLPNRRSCIALADAFLAASDGVAVMLPRLTPIGDIDEDSLFETDPFILDDDPELLPAIAPLDRQLLLTQLILKRGDVKSTNEAYQLAVELARFIDRAHTEGIDLTKIDTLVTGDLAIHWQITKDFLHIVTDAWPKILKERGETDPAQRRNVILQKKARSLTEKQPTTRIIAAGSTGSIPATAQLLNAIARLPNGSVILPGFEPEIDQKTWDHIDLQHPYYFMKKMLEIFTIEPKQVKLWKDIPYLNKQQVDIAHICFSAMQPKEIFDLSDIAIKPDSLSKHRFIQADSDHHESQIIALILRDIINTPEKTAMVVTPDRTLAKLIQTEMLRWNVAINDSGGEALDTTRVGSFLRQIVQFNFSPMKATACLALLRHPLTHEYADLPALEKILRDDPIPPGGLKAVAEKHDLGYLKEFLDLVTTDASTEKSLHEWIQWHIQTAEKLDSGSALWTEQDGESAAMIFHGLLLSEHTNNLKLTLRDYEQFITSVMGQVMIRPRYGLHPRITILSPIEARLQQADTIILAGLNDGVWPSEPEVNPWLSRPMQNDMGFEDVDRRIGQSALDFLTQFCTMDIFVTWSKQREGVLAQPSRWLQQIFAVLQKAKVEIIPTASEFYQWTKQWDQPDKIVSTTMPVPAPDIAKRPKEFWVTDIELWQKDPYSFYAKRLLDLKPLPLLDRSIDHKEWGSAVHDIFDRFFKEEGFVKPDPKKYFDAIAARIISDYDLDVSLKTQWQNKLHYIGDWLIASYNSAQNSITECTLSHDFKEGFRLSGRADRVDIAAEGLIVTDYKTGGPPPAKRVKSGKAPQLPLLGFMASQDKRFKKSTNDLHYVQLQGKPKEPAKITAMKNVGILIKDNVDHLLALFEHYYNQPSPYTARILATHDYDDYSQLKRPAEWAAMPEEADDDSFEEAA